MSGSLASLGGAPGDEAVRAGERTLSYAELDDISGRIAGWLRARGAGPGARVALLLDRSLEGVLAVCGVLRAGAAYVPLDPVAPPARNAAILEDCAPAALITAPGLRRRAAPVLSRAPIGAALELSEGAELPPPVPAAAVDGEAPAYVLYTSGSTGRPKGVVLSHRAGLAFARWAGRAFGLGPGDRVSGLSPLQFDLSTLEIFATLLSGATVCVAPGGATAFPATLAGYLEREQITVWYSVPGVLARLLEAGLEARDLPALRAVLFAGEVFPTAALRRLVAALPGARFANLYGPTETNVVAWHALEGPPEDDLPIGVAASDATLRIERPDGGEAGVEEPGELLVAGPSLLSGYLGDPEATAAAFAQRGERRYYRTGDRVRLDAAGRLRFMGRLDNMMKLDGWRVQPEEIEAALASHPGVREALARKLDGRLEALVVASGPPPEAAALLRHCAGRLPRYMLPARLTFVDALPRTDRGKLER